MPTAALGYQAKMGIGDAAPTTVALDFRNESLSLNETWLDMIGMRGTRAHQATRVRPTYAVVGGQVSLTPTPVEMAGILKYCLGGTPSGTSYPFAETLPAFVIEVQRSLNKMFTYTGLRVNRAVFQSRPQSALELNLDLFGTAETSGAASGFPALTLDGTTLPFIHSDLALVVNGTTIDVFNLSITIDNAVQGRIVNALSPTVVFSTDRQITWSLDLPYGDAEAMYGLAQTGVACTATWTNGTVSLILSSPKVQFPKRSPNVQSREETHITLEGNARYNSAAGDELVCTLDSTP
jgi:hypothetical protein